MKLTGQALSFWKAHAPDLRKRGILARNSVHSFVILCQTWAKLQALKDIEPGAGNFREMVQLHSLNKDYLNFAKQFGLLPAAAKASKLADAEADEQADEFGY